MSGLDFILKINIHSSYANRVDPYQMPRFDASDLSLHYLSMSFLMGHSKRANKYENVT